MGLFDMTFETGIWEFRHRILAPLALIFILPLMLILFGLMTLCGLVICTITGERSTDIKKYFPIGG